MSTSPIVGSPTSVPIAAAGRRARAVRSVGLSRWITVVFSLFIASLPFEGALPLGREYLVSIPRLLGYLLFALALLQPRVYFKPPPRAMLWFVAYFVIYSISGFFQPSMYAPMIWARMLTLTQLFMLSWLAYNLFLDERTAKWCWRSFGLASLFLSVLLAVGLGSSEWSNASGRETVGPENPNAVGAVVALGGVALIGMSYGATRASRLAKLATWGSFPVIAVAIARTGSRGALVALGAGLLAFLVSRGSVRTRTRNAFVLIVMLGVCYWVTSVSATAAQRWRETLEEGNTAGRQGIFTAAWGMFEEKPVFGWGPATNLFELGARRNTPLRDTHNTFLWLLTEVGLVGAIPFCWGLALCVRSAWRGRRTSYGLLPLALLLSSLTVNLSGTEFLLKWFWIILAYSLVCEARLRRQTAAAVTRPRSSGQPRTRAAPWVGDVRRRPLLSGCGRYREKP